MSNTGGQNSTTRSMVAKRLLFRQPKVTKVYPDSESQSGPSGSNGKAGSLGPLSTEAAKGTRKLLASFDSDESAYQSGNSSPAASGPQPATVGADESASSTSTVTTVTSGVSPKSALDRLTPLDAETGGAAGSEGTASLGCIELGEVRAVKSTEDSSAQDQEQQQQQQQQQCQNAQNCNCEHPSNARPGGRCVHFSNENPASDAVSEVDAAVEDGADEEGDNAAEAEFRDRLKRLFGLQPRRSVDASASVVAADASGSAASIDPDSNVDLRQLQQQHRMHSAAPQSRSRRQSLAARIFGRLPTALGGRRRSGDSGGAGSVTDLGSEATGSTTGGPCSVCGEPNCETHAEMTNGCWPRRHMRLMGCFKTIEERERAQMLENNLVARVTTIVVVIIILGLIIGLIVLASTAKSSSSGSTTATTWMTTAASTTVQSTTASTNATG
ncbi:hypothetical protein BOX15_Mlig032052g1 [Macrostomum lignano]|uniref:Uncharacterized protein n=1 Tax=Macrostomum lignano TaxID=282301 RepID=A0A267H7D5_9PLAT|nr:hypothetical protein BOX15_Mlig032052g1 [Macrostomum lignano]